jgi:nitrous oxide reductase accessory protein NosL
LDHNTVNLPKKSAVCYALLLLGILLAGCSTNAPKDTSIPWNKPADWEGELPGMNSPGH